VRAAGFDHGLLLVRHHDLTAVLIIIVCALPAPAVVGLEDKHGRLCGTLVSSLRSRVRREFRLDIGERLEGVEQP
jgi:lauroyl/myristoyl acyltransferase